MSLKQENNFSIEGVKHMCIWPLREKFRLRDANFYTLSKKACSIMCCKCKIKCIEGERTSERE